MRFDPPDETRGKGTPVKGIKATIALRLISVWIANQAPMPIPKSWPKRSGARDAITNAR